MDKAKILKMLASKININKSNTNENYSLINDIEEARKNLECARMYFDLVKEPRLVDYAIYTEEAAKAKYVYLILKAREEKVKLKDNFMLNI
ncbi:MAG: hypothetical protein K0R54_4074 [Clostridiaceae bacterium]|jgi:hypothetical protein|nr:hypothetical protein [Clostridiaceae bacterium]